MSYSYLTLSQQEHCFDFSFFNFDFLDSFHNAWAWSSFVDQDNNFSFSSFEDAWNKLVGTDQ